MQPFVIIINSSFGSRHLLRSPIWRKDYVRGVHSPAVLLKYPNNFVLDTVGDRNGGYGADRSQGLVSTLNDSSPVRHVRSGY